MRSSLLFQMITEFNLYYLLPYNAVEAFLFLFKGSSLPYPGGNLACDVIIYVLAFTLEYMRLSMGRKGNLTENQFSIVVALVLTVPCVLAAVHVLVWQTYVLKIERVLAGINLVFHGLEMIYCVILAVGFTKKTNLNLT